MSEASLGAVIRRFLRAPADDYLAALGRVAVGRRYRNLVVAVGAAVVSWWVYVPVHELLHAFGCLATGGTVTRLEIDAVYGAALLREWFPFVSVGSDYAGQLTGFDTGGSSLVYLATDLAPFLLTVLLGVPLLVTAGRTMRPLRAAMGLGLALPVAFAPFISIPGDYYEIGSILISDLASFLGHPSAIAWRGDDVFLRIQGLAAASATPLDVLGVFGSLLLGTMLAFATYGMGRVVAERGARRLISPPRHQDTKEKISEAF